MNKFVFIFVSKDNEFKMPESMTSMIQCPDIKCEYISNNSRPLPSVYNDAISRHTDASYIALVHADVKFDIQTLCAHIVECKDKYDVMGLCGCSKISISQKPFNWFCGSRPYPESRWGCVTHGELNNQRSYFSSHSPNVFDHEVACIDGLCIIFSKKAIDSGLRFDETLGNYNLYDTDISFQTVMKYNLRLGVLVTLDLHHYSVGKSILTPEFADDEARFRKKWNF